MRENIPTLTYSFRCFVIEQLKYQYLLTLGGSSSDAIILFIPNI